MVDSKIRVSNYSERASAYHDCNKSIRPVDIQWNRQPVLAISAPWWTAETVFIDDEATVDSSVASSSPPPRIGVETIHPLRGISAYDLDTAASAIATMPLVGEIHWAQTIGEAYQPLGVR
ncbi:uncharacterized protein N7459_000589 [Penicillium hispanicum]|uniref:uncharacterized protein n=1 Tax=Penicillium hispanicum TaxID=1080232 RepID=UPI0025414536|nr:uncharacterized protein N7459_000589 [Penicillium hispanicum]KAJ5594381.1 hypothetical protein N7459_000589 [Penicillium hispanicum]